MTASPALVSRGGRTAPSGGRSRRTRGSIWTSMARAHVTGGVAAFVTMTVCCAMLAGALDIMVGAAQNAGGLVPPSDGSLQGEDLPGAIASITGMVMAITTFAGVFLMGQAVSFALEARRREMALLRLAGARPKQLARLVGREYAAMGAIAGVLGWVVGWPVAILFGRIVIASVESTGTLDVTPRLWTAPIIVAAGTLIAAFAARAPARRGARSDPIAAVSETVPVRQAMTVRRWCAVAILLAGTVVIAALPGNDLSGYGTISIFLNLAALGTLAALAPVLVPPAARLLGPLARRVSPGAGRLAVEHIAFAARRSASLAVPLLLGVGIPGGLLILVLGVNQAQSPGLSAAELAERESANIEGIAVLSGMAVVMAFVAMAMSAIAGARERRGEFEALRRLGASRRQIVGSAAIESLLIVAISGLALLADFVFVWWRAAQLAAMTTGEPELEAALPAALFALGAIIQVSVAVGAAAWNVRETP